MDYKLEEPLDVLYHDCNLISDNRSASSRGPFLTLFIKNPQGFYLRNLFIFLANLYYPSLKKTIYAHLMSTIPLNH